MSEQACPSAEELSAFLLGTLSTVGLESIANHLDRCPACDSRAAALEQLTDPLIAGLRRAPANRVSLPTSGVIETTSFPQSASRDKASSSSVEQLGDYRILREIGRGGMGIVYEAEQVSLGRRVALKVLPRHALLNPGSIERFHREARSAARLHHTHIVPIFGVGEADGLHYFVMQLIPGTSLDAVLRGGDEAVGSLTLRRVAGLGIEVAVALAFAHAQGVVHRDIKPSNLLLDPDGRIWVTDFGLAKEVSNSDDLTNPGCLVGTLRYLPPECFEGPADARGDIYSLGLTLYEMLTLRQAFPELNHHRLMRQVREEEPPRPRSLRPGIPYDLETIVLKAISRNPAHRYQSATSLAEDLRRFVDDRPIHARRVSVVERLVRWCRREPRTAILLASLLLTFLVGLGLVLSMWRRAESKAVAEENARERAERAETIAGDHLYFSLISQARLEWRLNNLPGADSSLQQCELSRRKWEWHHLNRTHHADLFTASNDELVMVIAVAFSSDRRLLAFGGWNPFQSKEAPVRSPVELWDITTHQRIGSFRVPFKTRRLSFHRDGRQLAVSGTDGSLRIWDGVKVQELPAWDSGRAVSFTPDGRFLVAETRDGIWLHDPTTGQRIRRLTPKTGRTIVSGDGRLLALAGGGAFEIIETASGRELSRLPYGLTRPAGSPDPIFRDEGPDIAFSPDGTRIVTATNPPAIWDALARRLLHVLGTHTGIVLGVAFSPDGRHVATAGADSTVRLWDVRSGAEIRILRGHRAWVGCVAFHPDGWCLASGGRQPGEVKLWDLTRHVEYIAAPDSDSQALTFDASGRLHSISSYGRLQSSSPDKGDTRMGHRVELIAKWLTPARLADFSDEGHVVTVGKDGRTVKRWDRSSGKELNAFAGLQGMVMHVAGSCRWQARRRCECHGQQQPSRVRNTCLGFSDGRIPLPIPPRCGRWTSASVGGFAQSRRRTPGLCGFPGRPHQVEQLASRGMRPACRAENRSGARSPDRRGCVLSGIQLGRTLPGCGNAR